ncbi:unnamed protein product [Sympodiomycopsis kandeliae]
MYVWKPKSGLRDSRQRKGCNVLTSDFICGLILVCKIQSSHKVQDRMIERMDRGTDASTGGLAKFRSPSHRPLASMISS